MCNNNNKQSKEDFWDFMYRKPWRTILCSFLVALIIVIISFATANEGGLTYIILYPAGLAFYGLTFFERWVYKKRGSNYKGFRVEIIFWLAPLFMFILFLIFPSLDL